MQDIKIVQIEDMFFAGHHIDWMEDEEYAIIGYGETEEEALKKALEVLYSCFSELKEKVCSFVQSVCCEEVEEYKKELFSPCLEYEGEDGENSSSFSYSKEEKEWFLDSDAIEIINDDF